MTDDKPWLTQGCVCTRVCLMHVCAGVCVFGNMRMGRAGKIVESEDQVSSKISISKVIRWLNGKT